MSQRLPEGSQKKSQRQLQADAVSSGFTTVLHCSHVTHDRVTVQRSHTAVNAPAAGEVCSAGVHAKHEKGPHVEVRGPEIKHQINSLYAPTHSCADRRHLHLYAQTVKLSDHREGTMGCSHLGSRLRPYGYEHFAMSIPAGVKGCEFCVPARSFVERPPFTQLLEPSGAMFSPAYSNMITPDSRLSMCSHHCLLSACQIHHYMQFNLPTA